MSLERTSPSPKGPGRPGLALVLALSAVTASPAVGMEPPPGAPHHSVEEHSYDRTDEARRDRIEEPDGAWSGPTEPDTSGAVDLPVGIRQTPTPATEPTPRGGGPA